MDIRLGIADVAREIALETDASAEEVTTRLKEALADGGVFELTDKKGRQILVPVARLGFVELGSTNVHPVGFGAVQA